MPLNTSICLLPGSLIPSRRQPAPPSAAPANAILDEAGTPVLDESGHHILAEEAA